MTDSAKKNRTAERGELVVVSPGDESERVIDEAVRRINHIYTVGGLETAKTIGEYLLETFFDGDLEAIRDRSHNNHSFRKLAEREDLYPSATFLYTSVAVLDQLRVLPENVAEALPLSHHRLLLPIKDPEQKKTLAASAVERRMNCKQLNSSVEKVLSKQPKKSSGGRPRLPTLVKELRKLTRVVEAVNDATVPKGIFLGLEEKECTRLLEDLDGQISALARIRETLGRCAKEK